MGGLNFTENDAVEEAASALNSLAGLCTHRPDRADLVREKTVELLDEGGAALLADLAGMLDEGEDVE